MIKAYVVDIGNTTIKAALFQKGGPKAHIRISHDELALLEDFLGKNPETPVIISSTAALSVEVPASSLAHRKVLRLDQKTSIPLKMDYERSTLGLDRLANAVAGNSLNPEASLVIDAGTCITYDYTLAGVYMGGNISPGWDMRLNAMHHFTGRLPQLEKAKELEAMGKNTSQAMRAGAHRGLHFEVSSIITEFESRYPQGSVYITGGDGPYLAERIENVIFAAPFLTLKGLYEILLYTS
mgnify:FL=1